LDDDELAAILIHRPLGLPETLRTYDIELDGEPAGSLAPGEQLTLPVLPGAHVLRAALAWTGSPPLRVTLLNGEVQRLQVRTCSGLAGRAVIGREGWLTLTTAPD
jgi:hypothetical protein